MNSKLYSLHCKGSGVTSTEAQIELFQMLDAIAKNVRAILLIHMNIWCFNIKCRCHLDHLLLLLESGD